MIERLSFGNQKLNLHPKGKEIEPKAYRPACGSVDLCLITTTDIEDIRSELKSRGVEIIKGIVETYGATGPVRSVSETLTKI